MRDHAVTRLQELRAEFEAGQARLHTLEVEEARLREALLRISGAIQVLEELLAPGGEGDAEKPHPLTLSEATTPPGR
jgi:predicted nuclease with TOPRIM domain